MPVRARAICMLPFCHLPPTLILAPSFPYTHYHFHLAFFIIIIFPIFSLHHSIINFLFWYIFFSCAYPCFLSGLWQPHTIAQFRCVLMPSGHVGMLADSLIWTQWYMERLTSIRKLVTLHTGFLFWWWVDEMSFKVNEHFVNQGKSAFVCCFSFWIMCQKIICFGLLHT